MVWDARFCRSLKQVGLIYLVSTNVSDLDIDHVIAAICCYYMLAYFVVFLLYAIDSNYCCD